MIGAESAAVEKRFRGSKNPANVRREATADASFALILALIQFGMAMPAIIRITATTIRSSMRENPLLERYECFGILEVSRRLMM